MNDDGPVLPVKPNEPDDGKTIAPVQQAAAPPGQRRQGKALFFEPVARRTEAARQDDLEPRLLRLFRQRQAVGQEIPVLGGDEDDGLLGLCRSFGHHKNRPMGLAENALLDTSLAAGTALAFSALGTGFLLDWLKRHQRLDRPNERSSHDAPTPRGAGPAVLAAILLGWFIAGRFGTA